MIFGGKFCYSIFWSDGFFNLFYFFDLVYHKNIPLTMSCIQCGIRLSASSCFFVDEENQFRVENIP